MGYIELNVAFCDPLPGLEICRVQLALPLQLQQKIQIQGELELVMRKLKEFRWAASTGGTAAVQCHLVIASAQVHQAYGG